MNTHVPGIARWHMFAGGTFERYGRHGYRWPTNFGNYVINPLSNRAGYKTGYSLTFENVKGLVPGGLNQEMGLVRSPVAGAKLAREHYAMLTDEDRTGRSLTRLSRGAARNPRRDWHEDRYRTLVRERLAADVIAREAETDEARRSHAMHRQYLTGKVDEEAVAIGQYPRKRRAARNPGDVCDVCRVPLAPDNTCPKCGVDHGDPCPACGRRGYHKETCPVYIKESGASLSHLTERQARNPDDDPAGLPGWTKGLRHMLDRAGKPIWVSAKPVWGTVVTASGKRRRTKFFRAYAMGPAGERIELPKILKDEMVDPFGYTKVGKNPKWLNSAESYAEAGRRAGRAMRYMDHATSAAEYDWFRRALLMEDPEDRSAIRKLFEDAYRAEATPSRLSPNPGKKHRGRRKRPFRVSDVKKWEKKTGVKMNPGTDMGSLMKHPGFRKALKLYRQIHGCDPKSVKRVILPVGDEKKITSTDFFVALGKAPADSYEPNDRQSKKYGKIWVHPYDHKPIKAVDKTGKFIVTLPGSHRVKAGADGEAWIHGN